MQHCERGRRLHSFFLCRGCSEGSAAASGRGSSWADGPGLKGLPVTAVRGMLGKPKHLGVQNGRMVSEYVAIEGRMGGMEEPEALGDSNAVRKQAFLCFL